MLVAYRVDERAVFLYGFAKNERDNINPRELADWQKRAREVLSASDELIEKNIADEVLREVYCGQEKET